MFIRNVQLYTEDKYGSISTGEVGNVVLLNYDLLLKAVIIRGKRIDLDK